MSSVMTASNNTLELIAEIAGFFDDFVEAFVSFNGSQVAARYFVPGVALRGDGSIQSLQSRAEVERSRRTSRRWKVCWKEGHDGRK
jgi:hypothetical protein